MRASLPRRLLLAICVLACGAYEWPGPPQASTVPSTQRRFGDYTVFYSAVRTDVLPPEVLERQGLPPPGAHTVLVNVAVRRDGANVPARVAATVVNDADQVRRVKMRKIGSGGRIGYLGVVHIGDPQEVLTFRIRITPAAAEPFDLRFRRDFVPVPETTGAAGRHGVASLERH